jgi:hypothetical protein
MRSGPDAERQDNEIGGRDQRKEQPFIDRLGPDEKVDAGDV